MKAVIFDMDGVIVDSEPVYLDLIGQIYNKVGAKVDEETHLSSLGCDSEEWWQFIIDEFKLKGYTKEDLANLERDMITEFFKDPNSPTPYFKGIKEVLKLLKEKGYKTALASASAYRVIKAALSEGNLEEYFDVIVSANDPEVEKGKPEPDIFLYAADKLGVLPENCLVVEDSPRGLTAAKKANMKAAAFLSAPIEINTDEADFVFNDYEEFKEFLHNSPINQ